MSELARSVGQNIRLHRRAAKMTLSCLAEKTGTTPQTIHRLPYVGTPEDLGHPVELSGPNGKSVRMYVGGFPRDAMSFTDIPFPGVLR